MATRLLQNSFNQGEFSPEMVGRSDVDQYYSAAETLQNVVVLPQGGVKRRDGLRYLATIPKKYGVDTITSETAPNGGSASYATDNDDNTILLTNAISTTNPFSAIEVDLGSDKIIDHIQLRGVRLLFTGSSDGDFAIQFATESAPTSWFSLIWGGGNPNGPINLTGTSITYNYYAGQTTARYIRLVKLTSTDLGSNQLWLAGINVHTTSVTEDTETRLMPFEYNKEQTYTCVFTDKNIAIYEDGVFQANVWAGDFDDSKLDEINWTQSADTAIIVHEDVAPHSLVRGTTSSDWTFSKISFDYIPKYDFTPTSSNPSGTITPSATDGVITITASGTPFTDAATDVGQYIDGGGGRARVIQFLTTSTVKAVVLIPFYDTTAITSGAWVYETGYVDAWSTSYGWPKSCTFHDGRLWFGGSKSLPQTLWASKVGLYFDFDQGQVYDDDAINVTLDTDQVNGIVNLFSQRTLQIFTSGAEFAVFQSSGVAVTPSNIDIRRQTQEGSKKGVRPSVIDGATIFLKFGGNAVMEYLYSDVEQAYSSNKLTVASSHLIVDPVDMAVDRTNANNEASLLFLVNSDGTMAVGSILRGQNVLAFTEFTTPAQSGSFKNVVVDASGVRVITERTIDGATNKYLEEFDGDYLMDMSSISTGVYSQISSATAWQGSTVKLRVDGTNATDVYVNDGTETGSITAFADYSGTVAGTVLVTSTAHGLTTGHDVVISGTTNYNGTFTITTVDANSYYITDTWVSDDATGTWTAVAAIVPVNPNSTTSVEYGYNFTTTVKDLPVEFAPQNVRGQGSLGKKKRVSRVTLRLNDTSGITVNSNTVTVSDYTVTGANTGITDYTGLVRVEGIYEFTEEGQVTIAQAEPNPMTLLALSKEVRF